ncbi:MAG: ATP-binding domain-containing protein [Planctomycetes bacterium]|nr:ATP-binding domain-containing protein [Planctomycetota bacterium]
MDNKDKKHRAKQELDILEGVINYADRMIYEEGKLVEYSPLRRHAYGKTVVIHTEKQGTFTFRLSSTSVVYPNFASGYATPHSPVGRLCSVLQAGEEGVTPRWGEYTVSEIRLFDRFDGAEFEPNVRNFLRMDIRQEEGRDEVTNLRAFLNSTPEGVPKRPSEQEIHDAETAPSPSGETQKPEEASPSLEQAPPPAPVVPLTVYAVDDEVDGGDWIPPDQENGDDDEFIGSSAVDEYFGLNETFYVNRTRQQDEVISRSPIGAMYVEGVAGSGKTSAALGRTKMLCDFNAQNIYEEAEFREIVGDAADYWSGKFAGQFSQESSVGFVRTGELIQYLKETCRRLDLPNLPVQEYPELRSRLRQFRQLERTRKGLRRWTGLDEPRGTHCDTTMAWLRAADRAIANQWADELVSLIPAPEELAEVFKPEVRHRAVGIARPAMQHLRNGIAIICKDLAKPKAPDSFALDGLAKRINNCIENIRTEVLGSSTLWVSIGERFWHAHSERELAQLLVAEKVAIYVQAPARLVFFGDKGLLDDGLSVLSLSGDVLPADRVTKELLVEEQCLVRDMATGETLPAVASDINDLYLRLLPESAHKLYVQQSGRLKRLAVQRGLGQMRLPMTPATQTAKSESDDEQLDEPAAPQEPSRSVRAVFTTVIRRTLLQPLALVADAYSEAIESKVAQFPDESVAAQIVEQLNGRKLAHEDIDLLLCLYHLIGRGLKGDPQRLSMPPLYQSVFIDEVQDFTEQQVYLMAEQARPEYFAVTVVGDPAQKLHNGNRIDVPSCFPGRRIENVQLNKNMRQADAPGIVWFSARFRMELQRSGLDEMADDELLNCLIKSPDDVKGPELMVYGEEGELVAQTAALLKSARPKETAAVILPSAELAQQFFDVCRPNLAEEMVDAELSGRIDLSRRHVRHFTAVTNAKGLEFDLVILPYFEHYDLTDIQHQNRMYVGLTRARRRLVLIGHQNRPPSAFDRIWRQYQDILAMAR